LKLCAKHQNRVASIAEVVGSEKFPRVLRGVGSFGLDGFWMNGSMATLTSSTAWDKELELFFSLAS
jgi:hypothetical protein